MVRWLTCLILLLMTSDKDLDAELDDLVCDDDGADDGSVPLVPAFLWCEELVEVDDDTELLLDECRYFPDRRLIPEVPDTRCVFDGDDNFWLLLLLRVVVLVVAMVVVALVTVTFDDDDDEEWWDLWDVLLDDFDGDKRDLDFPGLLLIKPEKSKYKKMI